MQEKEHIAETIDAYIAQFSPEIRTLLEQVRKTIREAAPGAQEKISWGMPTFWQNENIVHFAAAQKHIGFYPGESGVRCFLDKLTAYHTSKGAIQFPMNQPIPHELIAEITRFRVEEANARAKERSKRR